MKTEYEVRVLEIDVKEVVEKLENLGATKIGEFNQRRYVYDLKPIQDGKWIRLRTNGHKTTLAYKDIVSNTIDGTKEIEFTIGDFDTANEFLNKLGFEARSYQENKRIQYELNGVEIDIDSWPMIPTYLEIEANDEASVNKMIDKLDLGKQKTTTLNCDDIYRNFYNIDISKIQILKEQGSL